MSKVLVIGCGLAGLAAAVKSVELGMEVIMVAPAESERAQSVMAMGGINGALNTKGQDDSVEQHYEDTIKGGSGLNNPKAVKKLTEDAPDIIRWLGTIGTSFTRDENGNIDLRYFGGQKKMRTAYAGARTGKQLVTALNALCRKYEAEEKIRRYTGWRFLSLIMSEKGECNGAIMMQEQTYDMKAFLADSVIVATGGVNRVFGKTTGSQHCDACATGLLLQQGIELGDPEMVQYHPTTIDTPVKRMLITEAARGQGGRLYVIKDGKPWYFMEEWYPEFGALMPRDVVSQSIYKVCNELKLGIDSKNQVYLDVTHLPKDVIEVKLDEVVQVCRRYLNLDPVKEPIPVYPGVHYFMGGIWTDENHKTNIERVFAAGECSSQYHGANRLGGNSLLGAIHGGVIAAQNANALSGIPEQEKIANGKIALEKEKSAYQQWAKEKKGNDAPYVYEIEAQVAEIMNHAMGIYRNEKDLEEAFAKLQVLYEKAQRVNDRGNYYDFIRMPALILVAEAMIQGALERKESRGAHQRSDFPERDDIGYKKTTIVKMNKGCLQSSFRKL